MRSVELGDDCAGAAGWDGGIGARVGRLDEGSGR